ncbi:MAG: hypothetical protein JXA21_19360 [Anaerolineae bacterium]|nr:hypothetical protein [Anaerolineae bacterium]
MGLEMPSIYEAALREFLARLGDTHPRYSEALVYQQRLTENLAAERRYGATSTRKADRVEIIDRLNDLAQQALGISFSAFCDAQMASLKGPMPNNAPVKRHLERSLYRNLLEVYDDAQLEALCLDHFPEVYDLFGRGMRRDEKLTLLLDYCSKDAGAAEKLKRLLKE